MTFSSLQSTLATLEAAYNSTLDETLELVSVSDIKIKEALKNQLILELEWNNMLGKVKSLRDRADTELELAYASSMEKELRHSHRSTSISEAREFAKTDPDYKQYRKLLLDVSALFEDVKSAVETVVSRRYILNNLTNLVVSSSENHIL